MPRKPMVFPIQVPEVAMSTAPGFGRDGLQQSIAVESSVLGISGWVHHVAARRGSPPNNAETICHGGTARADGLEIRTTPVDRVVLVAVAAFELVPKPLTSAWMSGGPPLLTICGLEG